jgi:hypothetical protein
MTPPDPSFRPSARPVPLARPVVARRRRLRPAPVVAVLLAAALAVGCGGDGPDDRQREVAERGAEVMPFDLDATTHRFEPVADGLVQTVVADDPTDDGEVAAIRGHLTDEAAAFEEGQFGDPAAIHGHEMPGLAALEAGYRDIAIAYEPVEAGARITYTTSRPALIDALHLWAEAQVTDHGEHAEGA